MAQNIALEILFDLKKSEKIDQERAVAMGPLATKSLKTLQVPCVVTFHRPTGPTNAGIGMLVVVAVHARPNLLLTHFDIHF